MDGFGGSFEGVGPDVVGESNNNELALGDGEPCEEWVEYLTPGKVPLP